MPDSSARARLKWTLATEYPATNISGVALLSFAEELKAELKDIDVHVLTEQPELTSQAIFARAGDAELSGGDVYGSALSGADPLFAIPALPFHVDSFDHAKRLHQNCLPFYRDAFAQRGHHYLFSTIWPATGLWSDRPVTDLQTLRQLKLRTNDPASAEVFRDLGTEANFMPFAEAVRLLKASQLNAVLTSGDGGAGQKLWDYLKFFTPLHYAFPCSFTFLSRSALTTLTQAQADALQRAARRTEDAQAMRLAARIEANFGRMRANGVAIAPEVPSALKAELFAVGAQHTRRWLQALPADVRRCVEEK